MRFFMRVKRAALLVGLFCCLFVIQSSTGQAGDENKKPILAFFVDEAGYEFGGVIARTLADEQVVWLGTAFANQSVDMHLYRMSEDTFLKALAYKKDQEKDYQTVRPFTVKVGDLNEISRFSRTVDEGNVRTRVSLPISEPGIYYLQGQTGADTGEAIIVVSNIVAQAKEDGQNLMVWTVDSRTGKHVAGGELVSYNLQGERDRLSSGAIDSAGMGRITEEERGDLVVVHALGETAFIPLNYGSHAPQPISYGWWGGNFVPHQSTVMAYTYTDRSLYQPGDTVYFKSFAREDDDARYSPAQGIARVKVWTGYGDNETVVMEQSYPLSGNGTFDSHLILPKDVAPGDYFLSIAYPKYDDETQSYYGEMYGRMVYFAVDYYRKPEFGLDVVVERDRLIVGDTMRATVSGNTFSGEPLAGADVKYSITAGTYHDYGYYEPNREDDDSYRYGGSYGSEVQSGTVTLDRDGMAKVEVRVDSHEKFLPQVYRIEVTGNDSAENPVFESQNILVLPADYSIYQTDYAYGSKVGDETTIPLILIPNRDGVALSGKKLEATVQSTHWIREERPNEKFPYYREEIRTRDPVFFTTDGEGKAIFRYTPPESGSYELTIRGTDDRNNKVARVVWLWVADRDGTYYQGEKGGQGSAISVKTDKVSYEPSESVQLTLSSTLPDRDVWVTFERAGLHRSRLVELRGNSRTVSLPLVETDMPNTFISATLFSRTGMHTASTEIAVSAESKRLHFDLKLDKERYLPGETVSLEVIGTDDTGKAADAEVGVWAIDKALFELMEQGGGDIFNTFWHKRYANTASAHSLQGILFTSNLAERGGCFTGDTLVLMADGGERPIQDIQPGEEVLTRTSETDATLVPGRVGRVHVVQEDGYIIINDQLRVTAAHRMFVDGHWTAAGDIQIGDRLINPAGGQMLVETIVFERADVTVYNLYVERYHTFFAGDVWVHNSKGDGARSIFKDTAYWNPKVRLGEDGKARLTFKLPDNTTTWVISAVGANLATQVGQAKAEILVSKKTIIRPGLPPLMRVGDRVEAVASMSNNTDESLGYVVKATFDAGRITDEAERTLTLAPHSSGRQVFSLIPEKATESARFTVTATAMGRGADFHDAIVSVVPIHWSEFTDRTAQLGNGNATFTLKLPEDTERDRSRITLDLSSSLLGTLPTAMRRLIEYPYGCVEQTTSRLIPIILARQEKVLFADALTNKDTDAMLREGIQSLAELQKSDGSWGFWHEGDSNAYLTAYAIESLIQARTLGIEREKIGELLDNVSGYLNVESNQILSKYAELLQTTQASLPKQVQKAREYTQDLVSLAYAKSMLSMKVADVERMEGKFIPSYRSLDPNILALAVMMNIRSGEFDPEKNGANALAAAAKRDAAGRIYWEKGQQTYYASQDASTALAVRALTLAKYDRGFLTDAVRFLDVNRRAGYWSNTFATSQVARALIDFYRSSNPINTQPKYVVTLGETEVKRGVIDSPRKNVSIPIEVKQLTADSVLKIQIEGEGDVYSTLSKTIVRRADRFEGSNRGLAIMRRYTNRSEPRSSTLALGDTVQVDIRVSGVNRLNDRVVVVDHLPAGMAAVRTQFKNEGANADNYDYPSELSYIDEYTQDGVVITLDSVNDKEIVVRYLARVVNAGEFTAPPVTAELMYAPEANGYSASDRVTLTREQSLMPVKESAMEGGITGRGSRLSNLFGVIVMVISIVGVCIAGVVYLKQRKDTL